MTDLEKPLKAALSETFMFYLEAHIFHWNVKGPLFPQLHELFGEIYEDAFDAVDAIAERIRTIKIDAPSTPSELMKGARIKPDGEEKNASGMVERLLNDNDLVIDALTAAMNVAEGAGRSGLVNFLQDRIDRHEKWAWKLRATSEPEAKKTRFRRASPLYDRK